MTQAPTDQQTRARSLRSLIDELRDEGESDPHEIARRIVETLPSGTLRALLAAEAERIIADIARERIGESRRQRLSTAVRDMSRSARLGDLGFLDLAVFVPTAGWKTHAQLTASDLDEVAAEYRRREAENAYYAERYEALAAQLREAKCRTLRDLADSGVQL